LYVPVTILVLLFLEHLGTFGIALRRDYGPLLACTFMSWTASHLPVALVAFAVPLLKWGGAGLLGLWTIATLYFAFLMVCAVRTVFGIGFGKAVIAISLSWVSLAFETYILALASPFILYWAYVYFRGDISDIESAFRTRQSFHQNLVASTVNPNDAEAHYQLGLIYQRRRQYTDAITRFQKAVEIDPREIDAHYQLGRIAREQGRLQEAIGHFDAVVSQDDKHAHNEIWREIGATYLAASMLNEACDALDRYIERRSYDPEGLYYLGDVLQRQGNPGRAREMFERCIESVRTMPYYRRREVNKWSKLAQDKLKPLTDERS
jgi:tetratricopeptide (TPR) repeat protein